MSTDDPRPGTGTDTDPAGTLEDAAGATADDAGEDTAGDAGTAPRPAARRPSPAASAASRARRIGGSTRAGRPADAEPAPATSLAKDSGDTGARTRPQRPSRAEKAAGVLPPPPSAAPGRRRPATGTTDPAGPTVPAGESTDSTGSTGSDNSADAAAEAPAGPPAWLNWAPAAVLVAAAVTMAVILALVSHGVWWGTDTRSQQGVEALREKVLGAAKTCVVRTNTYKYSDLTAFEKSGLACTTGKQSSDFRTAVEDVLAKNAPKLKSSQSAQINKAAVESVVGKQWTILVFGQLQVTNSSTPTGRTDPFAAQVRMEQVGGKWLISSLRTVNSPVN